MSSRLLPAPSFARRAPSRLALLALALAVTVAHVWLLAPRGTLAPRPQVTWRVRWVMLPRQAGAQPPARMTAIPFAPANVPQTAPPAPVSRPAMHAWAHGGPRASPRSPAPARAPGAALARASAAGGLQRRAASAVSDAASGAASDFVDAVPSTVDPAPIRLPPPVTLRYRVMGVQRGQTVTGESTLVWSPDAPGYQAAWELVSPQLGQRRQTSEGALQAGGLAPERYGERQRGELAAHFDPAGRRVRFSANTPDAPWQPGMQDRLSAMLQLAALLAAAPDRYPAGSAIRLLTVDARAAAEATWQVEGDEALDIADRSVPCLKLHRDADGPYGSRTDLWLARNDHYLPVRLLATRFNGDTLDQLLQAWPRPD